MLKAFYQPGLIEAGCDEAGRGCLAGPVYAAAVILAPDFFHPLLNDSKKLTSRQRDQLRIIIENEAIAWSVASLDHDIIDQINILQASILAMQTAAGMLKTKPGLLLIDGNRFTKEGSIPYQCIVHGDATYASIAAASILAKTHRDAFMQELNQQFPQYQWHKNKGYPTADHIKALMEHGPSPYHRKSFHLKSQLHLNL